MNGAQAIIACLEKEGVEYVFGYPGVAITPFYDSILNSKIKTVLVREEQCAAHAASGYTRISGKTGVVAVTSGPGAENLITGIATAFADSIPMVCITGQVDSSQVGGDVFQEADITGAVESFVKFSYGVRNVDDIPRIFREAFYIAGTGRPGPVLIDLPVDVQKQELSCPFVYPGNVSIRTYKPTVEGHVMQIQKVVDELKKAKRPLLYIGGGVHLAHAEKVIREFSHSHKIPAVCTMMGLGDFPTDDPMFYGMVGNNGQKCGNLALEHADLLILVGARLADRSISDPDRITENKVVVHIDVDPAEIGKNASVTIPIVGDIRHVFTRLTEKNFNADYSEWIETLDGWRRDVMQEKEKKRRLAYESLTLKKKHYIDPAAFIHELSLKMEKNAILTVDVGQNQLWCCANAVIREGRFLTSGGMGTMGYAVPAAMGAKIAGGDRQVVAVCGDGGFQMTMMELATMMQYHIQAKIVVMKNTTLGLVRQYQHFSLGDRFSVIDLGEYPKLDMLTKAYDMDYILLNDMENMMDAIDAFLSDEKSVLLECRVDPEETV